MFFRNMSFDVSINNKYFLNWNWIIKTAFKSIYRQSPVKNQPKNHKVDNFHVLTKVPHNMRET